MTIIVTDISENTNTIRNILFGWRDRFTGNYAGLFVFALAVAGVYLTGHYDYLLFHSLAELFSIVVAFVVFVLAWKSQRFLNNGFLLFIGIAYLFIGVIDLVHTLAYKGMGVFPGDDSNLPTQLWIAARYLHSLSTVAAFFFLRRKGNARLMLAGYAAVTALLLLSIFYWGVFPVSFIEGSGLTPFKKISEYVISLVFLASIVLLVNNKKDFDPFVLKWLSFSLVVSIASELAFTEYVHVYGPANMLGHLLKITAFYGVYKAIVEVGFDRPFDILFRQLKQSEEALRLGESRLRRLVDSNIIGVSFTNISGSIYDVNDAFLKMTGYTRQDIDAHPLLWTELTPEEYIPLDEKAIEEALESGACTPFEKEYIRRDGSRVPVLIGFALLEGSSTDFICFILDLTEQKKAQEALHRIEWLLTKSLQGKAPEPAQKMERYHTFTGLVDLNTSRLLLDSVGSDVLCDVVSDFLDLLDTSAAIYEKNGDYALWTFASGWCRYLSRASRSMCGDVDDRAALDSGNWHCHESCWNMASKWAIEKQTPMDVGCLGGLHIYSVPVQASGQVVGAMSVGYGDPPKDPVHLKTIAERYQAPVEELSRLSNAYESRPPFMIELAKNRLLVSARLLGSIVERKQAEEATQLYAAQLERSNQDLKDFAFIASHDLQDPLRKIQAFGDRVREKYDPVLDREGKEYLERMNSSASRMQSMIQDLLAYSRVTTQAKPFMPVSLKKLAEEVISDLEMRIERSGGQVELGDLPVIEGDPVQIRQLLQNLIGNGLKFHHPGASPLVRVSGGPVPLSRSPLIQVVQIEVSDNGIGFDERYLERIFQPFQRLVGKSQYEGSGIGLAICRKIVERHNGSITAKSSPGQGTTFIVTLPVRQPIV